MILDKHFSFFKKTGLYVSNHNDIDNYGRSLKTVCEESDKKTKRFSVLEVLIYGVILRM